MSQRRWADAEGILANQGAALDFDYLERRAKHLNVDDLLRRLRER